MTIISRRRGVASVVVVLCGYLLVFVPQIYALDALPLDPSSCHPSALVTADNDIRLEGDDRPSGKPVAIPAAVADQLRAAARGLLARAGRERTEGLTCRDLFPGTYRISEPGHHQLFVARIYVEYAWGFYHLILYDPATGAVTEHPPRIWASWTDEFGAKDELIRPPFVSASDLFQDHHPQVVFEERAHNGNMWNAVIYHYFAVRPNLTLTRVLAREARSLGISRRDGLFVRELTQLSPSRLRLDTLNVSGPRSSKRTELGYVLLESPGPDRPFRVVERHPKDPQKFDCLVTCMGDPPSDDVFLREGNTFYY